MHTPLTSQETMSLAKGFYNIHKAIQYLDSVKRSPRVTHNAKDLLNNVINRMEWSLTAVKSKLSEEGRKMFHAEITTGDTLLFDNVFDELIRMTPQQREIAEQVMISIRKGEISAVQQ